MNRETMNRILDVQDRALEDGCYQRLHGEYEEHARRFQALMETLPQEQKDVIWDFLGASASMHLRLLELAVNW